MRVLVHLIDDARHRGLFFSGSLLCRRNFRLGDGRLLRRLGRCFSGSLLCLHGGSFGGDRRCRFLCDGRCRLFGDLRLHLYFRVVFCHFFENLRGLPIGSAGSRYNADPFTKFDFFIFEIVRIFEPINSAAKLRSDLCKLVGIAAVQPADHKYRVRFLRQAGSISLPAYSSIANCLKNLNCFWTHFSNIFRNFRKSLLRKGGLREQNDVFPRQNRKISLFRGKNMHVSPSTADQPDDLRMRTLTGDRDRLACGGRLLHDALRMPHKSAGTVDDLDPAAGTFAVYRLAYAMRADEQRSAVGDLFQPLRRRNAAGKDSRRDIFIVDELPEHERIFRRNGHSRFHCLPYPCAKAAVRCYYDLHDFFLRPRCARNCARIP